MSDDPADHRHIDADPNGSVWGVWTKEFGIESQLHHDRMGANAHALKLQEMNAYQGYDIIVVEVHTLEISNEQRPVDLR